MYSRVGFCSLSFNNLISPTSCGKKSSSGTRAEASVNNAFLNEGGVMEFADVMVQNIETMVRQTSLIPRFREFASSFSLLLNVDLYI